MRTNVFALLMMAGAGVLEAQNATPARVNHAIQKLELNSCTTATVVEMITVR